ncbi:MAG: hypothetical protein HND58_11365 [Planctomycetota bacterium]|nr:MAG: hypothetical protein HND58_11365 [Planctomycetota bacterium]
MTNEQAPKPKGENSPVSGDTGGEDSGRQIQHGQPDAGGRGSSMQGPRQDASGAPEGANQGGAPPRRIRPRTIPPARPPEEGPHLTLPAAA